MSLKITFKWCSFWQNCFTLRYIISYAGSVKYLDSHWFQIAIRMENVTNNQSYFIVDEEWMMFNAHTGSIKKVNRDHFNRTRPLLQPFLSPVYNHCFPMVVRGDCSDLGIKNSKKVHAIWGIILCKNAATGDRIRIMTPKLFLDPDAFNKSSKLAI